MLDSPLEKSTRDPELERIRKLQEIQFEAKVVGCVEGQFLHDADRYPDEWYYFGESEEEANCPTGCSEDQAGVCRTNVTPCGGAVCEVSDWVSVSSDVFEADGTDGDFISAICNAQGMWGSLCTGYHPEDCEDSVCTPLQSLCLANSALELSSARTRPLDVEIQLGGSGIDPTTLAGGRGIARVPAQSTATKAALAEYAAANAAEAALLSLERMHEGLNLQDEIDDLCSPVGLATPIGGYGLGLNGQTPASVHSRNVVEAYQLYREAVQRAVDLNVAVADAQRRNPNLAASVADQMTAAALSRGHAARLLVGGDETDYDFLLRGGLCSQPETARGVAKALELFRAVGICPADVQALPDEVEPPGTPITTFWLLNGLVEGNGSNGYPESGSVLQRLIDQRGVGTDYNVLDELGITLEECDIARRYLSQEYDAFFRDKLESYGETGAAYPIFAASRNPPSTPEPIAYSAGVGAANGAWTIGNNPTQVWLPQLGDESNGDSWLKFADATLSLAGEVLERAPQLAADSFCAIPTCEQAATEISSTLGYLATTATDSDVLGRLYVCADGDGDVDARVLGFGPNAGLQLVVGEAALDCALNGNVDGGPPCTLDYDGSEQVLFKLDEAWLTDEPTAGYRDSATVDASVLISPEVGAQNWYLVGPKRSGLESALPGQFRALTTIRIPPDGQCRVAPIFPDAFAQAGSLVTPSPKWCGHPHLECDGSVFDERIPLEDELSEDGDGIESSWKHYLALAQQAAAESDFLANEYIQAGLDLDRREEELELREQANDIAALHQLEELQRICGTNVDPALIVSALSAGDSGDLTDLEQDFDCSSASDEPPTCTCFAGKCLTDPLAQVKLAQSESQDIGELGRLLRCLGDDDSVYRAVTAGDTQLCYWHDDADENIICRTPEPGDPNSPYDTCLPEWMDDENNCVFYPRLECPMAVVPSPVVPDTLACPSTFVPPGDTTTERTGLSLHYFGTPRGAGGSENVCKMIRDVRDGVIPPDQVAQFVDGIRDVPNNGLTKQTQTYAVEALVFEPSAGGFFDLTLDDLLWKTSGSLLRPDVPPEYVPTWPCQQEAQYQCEGSDSLFCSTIDCADPAQRIVMADRVRNALLALATDLEGIDPLTNSIWLTQIGVPRAGTLTGSCSGLVEDFDGFSTCDVPGQDQRHYWSQDPDFEFWPDLPPSTNGLNSMIVPSYSREFIAGPGSCAALQGTPGSGVLDFMAPYDPTEHTTWQDNVDRFLPGGDLFGEEERWSIRPRKDSLAGLSGNWKEITPESCSSGLFYRMLGDPSFSFYQDLEVEVGPAVRIDFEEPVMEPIRITKQNALDALELMCAVNGDPWAGAAVNCDDDVPIRPRSISDLNGVGHDLICTGRKILEDGRKAMLFDLPTIAADALRERSPVGGHPALSGELAAAVATLRASLIELRTASPIISSITTQIGYDIQDLARQLRDQNLEANIQGLLLEKERAGHIGNCSAGIVGGIAGLASPGGVDVGGAVAGFATCANSAIQVGFLDSLEKFYDEQGESRVKDIRTSFRDRFEDRAQALARLAEGLGTTRENLDAALAHIQGLQQQARRSLNEAVWLKSLQASQQFNINSAMRRRFETARVRYEEAHGNAKRMAFLARRAIEARLGVRLESMHDTLPLVEAPSRWANSVCATAAVDYEEVRGVLEADEPAESYADAFIGSYVRNLAAVVESYRLVNNFHEGTDTSVVSLRDDVFNVRARCAAGSANMLASSATLLAEPWVAAGCVETAIGAPGKACIGISNQDEALPARDGVSGTAIPVNLFRWGGGSLAPDPGVCGDSCGLTTESRWQQQVRLNAGNYLLSWYAKERTGTPVDDYNPTGEDSVVLLNEDGSPASATVTPLAPEELGEGWFRYTTQIEVGEVADRAVFFVAVVPDAVGSDAFVPHEVLLGGVMLERAPGRTTAGGFEATDSQTSTMVEACEDTDGTVFRSTRWSESECMLLCPAGFSNDCSPSQRREYCYREASLHISQEQIEQGTQLNQAGFALGNFNYRIENVALNFVGTDVRNCEVSDSPSTCYAAGFVPYSIVHQGPYFVRNYEGEDFEVPLFTGNIEHARGLATERYITNPISDADKSLLADYTRYEFQGRPLDGNFVIRVWEDEGFDFNQIQDVQLILNYRYWTRFD